MPDNPGGEPRQNRLLAALPEPVYRGCLAAGGPVYLEQHQPLIEQGQPITAVYFPYGAVASLLIPMADGSAVEAATVGNEGMVGLPVFLGAGSLPMTAVTQVPGRALRLGVAVFRERLTAADGPLHAVLARYAQTMFTQLAQNVACNRLHRVEQRCARWLLMTADRVDRNEFPLTQEFLAEMLGVRRASVSETASRLAQRGLIRYARGVITILDRAGLEQASCECYGVIAGVLDRMLGTPDHPADPDDHNGGTPSLR